MLDYIAGGDEVFEARTISNLAALLALDFNDANGLFL